MVIGAPAPVADRPIGQDLGEIASVIHRHSVVIGGDGRGAESAGVNSPVILPAGTISVAIVSLPAMDHWRETLSRIASQIDRLDISSQSEDDGHIRAFVPQQPRLDVGRLQTPIHGRARQDDG